MPSRRCRHLPTKGAARRRRRRRRRRRPSGAPLLHSLRLAGLARACTAAWCCSCKVIHLPHDNDVHNAQADDAALQLRSGRELRHEQQAAAIAAILAQSARCPKIHQKTCGSNKSFSLQQSFQPACHQARCLLPPRPLLLPCAPPNLAALACLSAALCISTAHRLGAWGTDLERTQPTWLPLTLNCRRPAAGTTRAAGGGYGCNAAGAAAAPGGGQLECAGRGRLSRSGHGAERAVAAVSAGARTCCPTAAAIWEH